jgi:hypothetical protein
LAAIDRARNYFFRNRFQSGACDITLRSVFGDSFARHFVQRLKKHPGMTRHNPAQPGSSHDGEVHWPEPPIGFDLPVWSLPALLVEHSCPKISFLAPYQEPGDLRQNRSATPGQSTRCELATICPLLRRVGRLG